MVYDFQTRHNLLTTKMRSHNKVTVDIYRTSIALFETVEATCYEVSADELVHLNVSTDIRRRDYIITTADVLDGLGNPWIPQPGDEIRESTLVSQVTKMGPMAEWKFTSHTRVAMRVHTTVTTVTLLT